MSRSRRRHPVLSNTCSGSKHGEKDDKRLAHRKLRRLVRVALRNGLPLPLLREVSNVWDWRKDGKSWYDESMLPRWKVWGK